MSQNLKWYERISAKLDSQAFPFTFFTTVAILIGSLIEIPPFFMQGVVQNMPSVKPYDALELAGRDVYIQEGCSYCHTQMIRPFKWETDRWDRNREYGPEPYSKAGEYAYDHPFLWGSKRTGPDLSHEASLNSSRDWHKQHLIDPRATSPGSIMPAYPYLFETLLRPDEVQASMRALRAVGVPYTDADVAAGPERTKGKTQGDALIAYLLKLGRDTKVKTN